MKLSSLGATACVFTVTLLLGVHSTAHGDPLPTPSPTPSATDVPGVSELLEVIASAQEDELLAQAERTEVTSSIGTGTDTDETEQTGTSAQSQDAEPYENVQLATADPFICDAVDEDGNLGACPPAIEEVIEEEDYSDAEINLMIQEAFQSLPVAPSPISYQPDGDWAAVNMDFIVYTDTAQQDLDATILDIPINFRLTPSHWTWDFGDGSPALPTSQPGAPYPNLTVSHVYSSASDGVTITLTTLWSGQFQINGTGQWYPVQGFVTTTNTAGPIEIVAFDVRLVPNP